MSRDINIDNWLDLLLTKLKNAYSSRLVFVGYVGSRARGEGNADSDIDVNVVLEDISINDLIIYRGIVKNMPYSHLACGFICSKEEIQCWPTYDLVHFFYGCKVLFGNMNDVVNKPQQCDLFQYIKNATSMIMHEVRHRLIYSSDLEKEVHKLKNAYKCSFFIMQALMLLVKKEFIVTKKEMVSHLSSNDDIDILNVNMNWVEFEKDRQIRPKYYFDILEKWSSKIFLYVDKFKSNTMG